LLNANGNLPLGFSHLPIIAISGRNFLKKSNGLRSGIKVSNLLEAFAAHIKIASAKGVSCLRVQIRIHELSA